MNKIVILNLSDLHLDLNYESVQRSIFNDLLRDFGAFTKSTEYLGLLPRYIVIAGDIINRGNVENYQFAKELIQKICEQFKVPQSHVIMVPGNHDKKAGTISTEPEYRNAKDNFNEFCNLSQLTKMNDKTLTSFLEIHEKGFIDFSQFYCDLSFSNCSYPFITYPLLEESVIKYVSGIKIFEEDKLCFLMLNTEWLYADNSLTKNISSGNVNFEVGTNIVSYLSEQIKAKCPDYTIITLMHQSPYEMSWYDINRKDDTTKHTLGYIEHCSDIIISGHAHPVNTQMPDLMRNKIQHFRLGTSGWLPKDDSHTFPYSISVIKIDAATEKMELLRGKYEKQSVENPSRWIFKSLEDTFILRNKYEKSIGKKKQAYKIISNWVNIRVTNLFCEEEIVRKIKEYFIYDETLSGCEDSPAVKICNIDDFRSGDDVIDEFLQKESNRMCHLILYFKKKHEDCYKHLDQENTLIYKEIMEKYRCYLMLGKLVINFVIIEGLRKWSSDAEKHFGI